MQPEKQISASKKFREAWDILDSGNLEKAHGIINRAVWGGKSYKLSKELSREITWLQNYEYPEFKNIGNEIKREFILVTSWNFLMKDHSQDWGWALKENLSPFLGVDYNLDIDFKNIKMDLGYSEKSIFSDEVHSYEYWHDLPNNSSLSLLARSLFIRILKYAQVNSGGLTDSRNLGPVDADEIKQAVRELSRFGLISSDMSFSDFLMNKTIAELKKFAFENGLGSDGTKHQIIQTIMSGVQEEKVKQWLHEREQLTFIRPLVTDFQKLKKYIWSASGGIDLYLQWIQKRKYLGKSVESIVEEKKKELDAHRYDPLKPWRPLSKIHVPAHILKTKKFSRLEGIWDEQCDILLQEVVGNYAWDWELYIEKIFTSRVDSGKLAKISPFLKDMYLKYFCQKRMIDLGIDVPKSRLLVCSGCGISFMDWSVESRIAERVGYKILFCKDCYIKAFWGINNELQDNNEMLEHLSSLANLLGVIPTRDFRMKLDLSNATEESQIAIVKILRIMPPYEKFLDEFGSWLQALILANVLENGTQRTSRGIRCIANDGHVCNSLAEKMIDDWLSVHAINHEKEPTYPYHAQLNTSRMRADWKVQDIMIEYAGMMNEPSYAAKIKAKQDLAKEFHIAIVILEPKDILDLEKKLGSLIGKSDQH